MEPNSSFGQWVLERRKELRLQRAELAAQLGCAAITLRKIESDERRPSHQLAALLAERLGLPPPQRATFVRVARGELGADHLPALPLGLAAARAPAAPHEPITALIRTNLPAPLTSFVGRDAELAALPTLLAAHRLLTLTGVGGVGKIRLAIEVGVRMVRDRTPEIARDGIWLIELAALADPALVAPAIARALGLAEQPGRDPLEQLQEHLAERRLLLILDNCEHLVEACATVAERLLLRCWQLRLLATSRELLRIPGERELPVLPLALPSQRQIRPAQVLGTPAAQLFVDRMGAAGAAAAISITDSDAAALAQICHQLDGIPLAIELAAPLAASLPLAEIAGQLGQQMAILTNAYRTAIPRHQTMHRALVWSYRLLAPEEQRLLAACSVFAGGWALAAAKAVCADGPVDRLPRILHQVVAKSLVIEEAQGGQTRYRLLEPVRQFARAQLAASGEEMAVRRTHAGYYLAGLAAREAELKGAVQREALDAIARDSENVRTAWDWAAEAGAVDLLGQAVGALALAYEWLGSSQAGLLAVSKAVAATRGAASAELLALLLAAQARFTFLLGDSAGAADLLLQAQALLEGQSGAAADAARAQVLLCLGRCLADQDFVAAHAAFTQSCALFRALGDRPGQATALAGLGGTANSLHRNYDLAQHYLEQSVALHRELGNQVGLSEALSHLSTTRRYMTQVPAALACSREAYALAQAIGQPPAIARAGTSLGSALMWIGDYAEAGAVLHTTLTITIDLGYRTGLPSIYHNLGITTLYLGRYAEAREIYTQGLIAARSVDSALDTTYLLCGIGMVALAERAAAEARRWAAEALTLSTRLGEGFSLGMAMFICALAERHLGNPTRARAYIVQALRPMLVAQSPTHWTLWVIALLLADGGAPARAAEAFALAEQVRHEDNIWIQDIALREIQAIIAALPPQAWEAAQARWAGRDVWEAGHELLAELEADGWGAGA